MNSAMARATKDTSSDSLLKATKTVKKMNRAEVKAAPESPDGPAEIEIDPNILAGKANRLCGNPIAS
jgi:hypothetical protein